MLYFRRMALCPFLFSTRDRSDRSDICENQIRDGAGCIFSRFATSMAIGVARLVGVSDEVACAFLVL